MWHLGKPLEKTGDKSVPFTSARNHHYFVNNIRVPYGDLHCSAAAIAESLKNLLVPAISGGIL